MKKIFLFLILFSGADLIQGQCLLDKSEWIPVFEEEFTQPNLEDYSSHWRIEGNGGQDCHNYPDPERKGENKWIKIEEERIYWTPGEDGQGELNLTAQKLGNTTPCWNGETPTHAMGYIESVYDDFPSRSLAPDDWCNLPDYPAQGGFVYGMFELECKFPRSPGVNNAFWMLANNAWPTEIDVVEFGYDNPSWALSSVYYLPNAPQDYSVTSCGNLFIYPGDFTDEFHTWTMVWTPTQVTWFLDGKELKTDTIALHQPTYGFHPNSIEGICLWRKADIVINAGISWDWGMPGDESEAFILKSVKAYKPANLTLWEDWLAQKGLASGERKDFRDYYFQEIVPVYEKVNYKTEKSWVSSKVASYDPVSAGNPEVINYQCYSDLNVVNNGKEFVYKEACQELWKTTLNQEGNYNSMSLLPSKDIDGAIKAVQNGNVIFYRKKDQLFYLQNNRELAVQRWVDPLGNPCQEPETCEDTLGLFFKDQLLVLDNGLQIFYRGLDHHVYTAYRNSLTSNRWYENRLSSIPECNGPITIDSSIDHSIYYPTNEGVIRQLKLVENKTSLEKVIPTIAQVFGAIKIINSGTLIFYKTIDNNLGFSLKVSEDWVTDFVMAIPIGTEDSILVDNVKSDLLIDDSSGEIIYIGKDQLIWKIFNKEGKVFIQPLRAAKAKSGLQFHPSSKDTLIYVGMDNYIHLASTIFCEVNDLPCTGEDSKVYLEEENEKAMGNKLFPNPAGGDILAIDLITGEDLQVYIYNAQGILMRQLEFCLGGVQEVNISNLARGYYFVRIYNGAQQETLKFLRI